MRRREFIAGLGAAAWPLAVRAQQAKRVGVLMSGTAAEPERQSNLANFVQGLRKLGWIDGQNLQLEVRWSAGDVNIGQAYATDLVGLFKPDVLVAVTTANLVALRRATGSIPIVFTAVSDPVEQGFVPNLTHPGGNITGFAAYEFSIVGKWADLLKQMMPSLAQIAFVLNPDASPQSGLYLNALEAAAPALSVKIMEAPVYSLPDIESTIARLSRQPHVGLLFPSSSFTTSRAKLIVDTVARYRLPAIYSQDAFIPAGGLMTYSIDTTEALRLAPLYVDRILKGTEPGELPVQLPTKFKLIVNRKTASALGINVPVGLLLAADEVIE